MNIFLLFGWCFSLITCSCPLVSPYEGTIEGNVTGALSSSALKGVTINPSCKSSSETHVVKANGKTVYKVKFKKNMERTIWVKHKLTGHEKPMARSSSFYEDVGGDDDCFPNAVLDKIYSGSGMAKGHLAPYADFDGFSARASMLYLNVAPQDQEFNCGPWKSLEFAIRTYAKKHGKVTVITGTSGELKSLKGIPVPKYFWKVVKKGSKYMAFCGENTNSGSCGKCMYRSLEEKGIGCGQTKDIKSIVGSIHRGGSSLIEDFIDVD